MFMKIENQTLLSSVSIAKKAYFALKRGGIWSKKH